MNKLPKHLLEFSAENFNGLVETIIATTNGNTKN